MKGNLDTTASPEQPSGATLPAVKQFLSISDLCRIHTVTIAIAHLSNICHVPPSRYLLSYYLVVRPHPELLQQVNVVRGLIDEVPYGGHPHLLVIRAKICRHSPGVQSQDFDSWRVLLLFVPETEVGEEDGCDHGDPSHHRQTKADQRGLIPPPRSVGFYERFSIFFPHSIVVLDNLLTIT